MKFQLPAATAFAVALSIAGAAQALTVAPRDVVVAVPDFTGVQITEQPGAYTLINGSAGAVVLGFGVTNPVAASVWVGGDPLSPSGFLDIDGALSGELWVASRIDEGSWGVFEPTSGAFDGTLEDLFGAWSFGGDSVFWYEILDSQGVLPGETATGFFFDAPPASVAFGVGFDQDTGGAGTFFLGDISGEAGAVVPVPAAGLLLLTGAAGLVLAGRRRRA